jgi:putative PIG3 family NAD(P)H quinone oxidoreductase
MKAIIQTDPTDPSALSWQDAPTPTPADGEVLLRVTAAGLNRADTLQAQGHYPPPAGVTDVLGLEATGVIEDANGCVRPDGTPWQPGDEVGALLSGGAYAEYVVVPAGQLLPVPAGLSLVETASVIEVACTVWSNLMMTAHLKEGDTLLVHGGGGGVGLFAIQVAAALGVRVAVTAGSQEKLDVCARYGADILINYREEDFAEVMKEVGGADVILDIIGAKYLDRNVKALAKDGHLVIIGMQGGVKGELNIGWLLNKRGNISATGLRYRDLDDKARIVAETVANVWPLLTERTVTHHVDRVFPVQDAAAAHAALLAGEITGKAVLQVAGD